MRTTLRTAVLLLAMAILVAVAVAAEQQAIPAPGDKPADRREADWRTIPLLHAGAADKAWTLVGYGNFAVDGDSLRTEPDERGMGLLVYTKEKFGDCRLRVVYKTKDAKSNAGVFVGIDDQILTRLDSKAAPAKRDKDGKLPKAEIAKFQKASEKGLGAWWPVHHAYEIQICDTGDAYHRTGAVYSLAKAAVAPPADPGAPGRTSCAAGRTGDAERRLLRSHHQAPRVRACRLRQAARRFRRRGRF